MPDSLIKRMAQLESRLTNVAVRLGATTFTLTWEIQDKTGPIQNDPETGVKYRAPSPASIVTVQAYLTQFNDPPNPEDLEHSSANPSSIKVRGYCIEPYVLPASVRPSSEATAVSSNSDYPIKGTFLLLPTAIAEDQPGHSLYGYLNLTPGA